MGWYIRYCLLENGGTFVTFSVTCQGWEALERKSARDWERVDTTMWYGHLKNRSYRCQNWGSMSVIKLSCPWFGLTRKWAGCVAVTIENNGREIYEKLFWVQLFNFCWMFWSPKGETKTPSRHSHRSWYGLFAEQFVDISPSLCCTRFSKYKKKKSKM